jgi:predicted Co/Zn/Cd cation transporter (cation efflux family)
MAGCCVCLLAATAKCLFGVSNVACFVIAAQAQRMALNQLHSFRLAAILGSSSGKRSVEIYWKVWAVIYIYMCVCVCVCVFVHTGDMERRNTEEDWKRRAENWTVTTR